ncbi:MAG: hypothetical protein K2G38_02270 [Clostridia bacterium]|nr:hypothetical protein [Clostridia bacterium]
MKVSIIDVGSNSVRLATLADGKTLYKKMETTHLGEGVAATGNLSEAAIERTAQAVLKFYDMAQKDGAEKTYIFATAAVRNSLNRLIFINRVKELCSAEVEIMSGDEEARIGILGALKNSDGGIIDVGGASTEVSIQRDGKSVYSQSVNIGAVSLFEAAGRDREKILKVISEMVKEYAPFNASGFNFFAIGGTATRLAAIKHGLKEYRPEISDVTTFTLDELKDLSEKYLIKPVEEIQATTICGKSSALVGGGGLLICAVMQKFGIDKITVSESDNLEGFYLLKEGIR